MRGKFVLIVMLLLIVIAAWRFHWSSRAIKRDVTPAVEHLGTPFSIGSFARNVWDMQSFNGRIYLAHGNAANSGPDPNAGPIPVWYYDPAQNTFINQYTVNEEQIYRYRVLDGQLYIPGFDPRESWELGNFYRLNGDAWIKMRTIPDAIHTIDIISYQGKLFAATGTQQNNRVVLSEDMGKTWRAVLPQSGYTYELFEFRGNLYALWLIYTSDDPSSSQLYRFDGREFVLTGISGKKMVPGVPEKNLVQLSRITVFRDRLVYIATGELDNHPQDFGFYVASDLGRAQKAILREKDAVAYDILTRDKVLYVLASFQETSGAYVNLVYTTTDLRTWRELFRFTAPTFARSFEELNGDFYFGLGTTTTELSLASGDILRVRRTAYGGGTTPTTPTRAPAEGPRRVYLPLLRADGRRGVAVDSGAYTL